MSTEVKTNSFHYLSTICQDHSTFKTKIAAASLTTKRESYTFAMTILAIEYLQLVSQALLINPTLYNDQNINVIFRGVVYAAKVVNPSFWMFTEDNYTLTFVLFIIFILMTLSKFLMALYMFAVASKKVRSYQLLINLWKFIFSTQTRILCFFCTSFWVKVIMTTNQDGSNVLGISSTILIAISAVIISYEYVVSITLPIRFNYILPRKSLLSAKDNGLEMITLIQKLVIAILQMTISLDTSGATWVFTILNMFFSLVRGAHYYSTFPLYNMKMLRYQGRLLMIVFSLHVACFIQNLLDSIGSDSEMDFIVVMWVLLIFLTEKIGNGYFTKISIDLISNREQISSGKLLIHKIILMKYFRKLKKIPEDFVEKHEFSLLMNRSLPKNIEKILNLNLQLDNEDNNSDIYSKDKINEMFRQYLEYLQSRFPRDSFLKLYTAYFYAKKLKLYGIAMRSINLLQKSGSTGVSLGANLLIQDIEAHVEKEYLIKDSYLDVFTYLKSRSQTALMKQKILELIDMQKMLYREVLENAPNLEKICEHSLKVNSYKVDIEKRINTIFSVIPENYIRPQMIAAYYHLALSYSLGDYTRYRKRYTQLDERYKRFFKNDKLVQENLYQDDNVFLILSGDKNDAGKIIYCTKNIQNLYGSEAQMYIGTNMGALAPPALQDAYSKLFQHIATTGDHSHFGTPIRAYSFHKEGYLIEVDFYLAIHPFMTTGFYFDCIIRPVKTTKEYILVHENGDIEGATKKAAQRLGLLRSHKQLSSDLANIKTLSYDLGTIVKAFSVAETVEGGNGINKEEPTANDLESKYSYRSRKSYNARKSRFQKKSEFGNLGENPAKAKEICSTFKEKGKVLELASVIHDRDGKNTVRSQQKTYKYHCAMGDKSYFESSMRLIRLEQTKDVVSETGYDEQQTNKYSEKTGGRTDSEASFKDIQAVGEEIVDSEQSDFFKYEDEKQTIDVKFTSQGLLLNSSKKPEDTVTGTGDEPLFSPLSMSAFSPKAPLISQQITTENPAPVLPRAKKMSLLSKSTKTLDQEETHMREEHIRQQEFVAEGSVAASQKSRVSQTRKVGSAYKLALSIRYSPRSFKIMSFIFYVLLVAIIVTQLATKLVLDSAIEDLQAGKDAVTYVETRSYLLGHIQYLARLVTDLSTGNLNSSDLGSLGGTPAKFAGLMQTSLILLSDVNQELELDITSIGSHNRASFFESDVRVFQSFAVRAYNKYTNLTNLQAVDALTQIGLQAATVVAAKGNDTAARRQINYVLENTVNDLLVKNDEISDAFMLYYQDRQSNIDNIVLEVIIISVTLLGAVSVIFTIMIWKNFTQETYNLGAVAKLNSVGIYAAMDRVAILKRSILSEVAVENDEEEFDSDMRDRMRHIQEAQTKKKAKKEHSKTSDHTGVRKRYLFYTIRLWFFMIILVGLIVASCLGNRSSIGSFQTKQNRLYFINSLKAQVALVVSSSTELLATNGTTYNHNEPVTIINPEAIDELIIMRNRIASVFMNSDFTYESQIQDLLFGSSCDYLTGFSKQLCIKIQATGQKPGFVYLLADYENSATDRLNRYEQSDKSTQTLQTIQAGTLGALFTDYYVAGYICDAISSIVNTQFESEFASAQTKRDIMLVALALLVIIAGGLLWIFVLCKIRDANYQFKTVLQAFPPSLVLSSFILKNFLVKTSKGALDFVKNDI